MSRLITDVGLAPLTISLAATSFSFFGATMLEVAGPIPIIRNKVTPVELKPAHRVAIWSRFFRRAAVAIVGSALTNTVISSYTAIQTINPEISTYAWLSAFGSVIILPYTFVTLGKINTRLNELSEATEQRELTPAEDTEVVQLLEQWQTRHLPRFASYALAWGASLVAFGKALHGFRL